MGNSRADLLHMLWSWHELQKGATVNDRYEDVNTLRKYNIKKIEYREAILLSTAVRTAKPAARIQWRLRREERLPFRNHLGH